MTRGLSRHATSCLMIREGSRAYLRRLEPMRNERLCQKTGHTTTRKLKNATQRFLTVTTRAGPSIRRAAQILELISSPGTRPRSPIGGQHCREPFLQILDEVFGNLQRREVSPSFGRPPSDDLSVPLLCPGARILLDVAGILGDC